MASIGRASAMLASGTMVSRVLGFVRSWILAQAIGVTVVGANAYSTATVVPNSIYAIISQGILSAILVPQIVRASVNKDGGKAYINKLVTLGILIFFVVAVVATLMAPWLSALFGAHGAYGELVTAFAYWSLPQIFFLALYTLLGEVLNARKSFGPFTWAPVANNVVSIAMFIVFIFVFSDAKTIHDPSGWTTGMVALLGGGATLGIAVQGLILFVFWRRVGLSFRFDFRWRGVDLGSAGRAAGWTFAMIVGTQIAGVVETNVANTVAKLHVASVTVMSYAWLIFMLPFSIVAVSIVTAYYTRMAEHARAGDMASFRFDFSTATRTISLLISFFCVSVIVAAYPICVIFTSTSYSQMGNVLIAYAIGMIPFCMLFVVQRAFYSLGDTRTPFIYTVVQTVIVVIGVIGCLFVAPEFRAMGIALVVSLGGIVQALIAAVLLRRKMGRIDGRRIMRGLSRYVLSAVVAGAFGFAVLALLGGVSDGFAVSGKLAAIVSIAAIGVVMLAVYVGMLKLLRTDELDVAIGALRGRLLRRSGQ